jgi:putative phosphoesterase
MTQEAVPFNEISGTRIGFLADTHCREAGDLPQSVLDAFAGVDLIVHLGDIGNQGILDRLAAVAPVLATRNPRGDQLDEDGRIADRNRVLSLGGVSVGVTFELVNGLEVKPEPGKLPLPEGTKVSQVSEESFGRPVDVVAFGGTHMELQETRDGVLLFNPGSPTLPAGRMGQPGTVAILQVSAGRPSVEIIELSNHA